MTNPYDRLIEAAKEFADKDYTCRCPICFDASVFRTAIADAEAYRGSERDAVLEEAELAIQERISVPGFNRHAVQVAPVFVETIRALKSKPAARLAAEQSREREDVGFDETTESRLVYEALDNPEFGGDWPDLIVGHVVQLEEENARLRQAVEDARRETWERAAVTLEDLGCGQPDCCDPIIIDVMSREFRRRAETPSNNPIPDGILNLIEGWPRPATPQVERRRQERRQIEPNFGGKSHTVFAMSDPICAGWKMDRRKADRRREGGACG